MKVQILIIVMLLTMMDRECVANNQSPSDVVINEVSAETEASPINQRWAGNERPDRVSTYGAVKPIQLPVEYSGKAIDAVVSGVSRVLTFPFTALSHKFNTKNTGGNQHGQEKS